MPLRTQRLILPVAPLIAGLVGVLSVALFAFVPTDLLEQMVVDSGVASVLSAAAPPLGLTARLALIVLCGGGAGLVTWFAMFLAFGSRTVDLRTPRKTVADSPTLRRADAHPDAPPRRPIFANTDLGTPFQDVRARPVHVDAAAQPARVTPPPAEQPLPADLDQPLAAFDPAAIPEQPLDWFPPPATLKTTPVIEPRSQTFGPDERFETFSLTPMVRPAPPQVSDPAPPAAAPVRADPSETIHALLDRLERLTARREPGPTPTPPQETIEESLIALRRMAGGR